MYSDSHLLIFKQQAIMLKLHKQIIVKVFEKYHFLVIKHNNNL